MIVFFVKFWGSLKKFVLGVFGVIVFVSVNTWSSIKRTYENFSSNFEKLWKFIVTGDVGDLSVQPSLFAVIVYLFFSEKTITPEIIDPGDYTVSIVGFVGGELKDSLVNAWADYQSIDFERARVELINNLPLHLGIGIKEVRVNELKIIFESAGALLEIIRTSIEN